MPPHVLRAFFTAASLLFLSLPASAYHDEESPWVRGTAYTLRGGEFSLGIVQWEAGILDQIMIGTCGPLWFAGPVLGGPVPNASFKMRSWFAGPLAVSLGGTFLYLDGSRVLERATNTPGQTVRLYTFSVSGTGSYRFDDHITGTVDLTFAKADIAGQDPHASIAGAAVTSSFRVGFMGEYRFSRLVALQLKGRVLLYRNEPTIHSSYQPDPWTDVNAELETVDLAPVFATNGIGSVALSGKNVNFAAGVGYGYGWIPLVDFVLSKPGITGEADLFVRF